MQHLACLIGKVRQPLNARLFCEVFGAHYSIADVA